MSGEGRAELLVKWFGVFGRCSPDKGGAISLPCACMESELTDNKRASAGIEQRAVHAAFRIFKNTEACDLSCEPLNISGIVSGFDAQKDKKSGLNRGDDRFFDRDGST